MLTRPGRDQAAGASIVRAAPGGASPAAPTPLISAVGDRDPAPGELPARRVAGGDEGAFRTSRSAIAQLPRYVEYANGLSSSGTW